MKDIHDLIINYENFPKEGISFKDVLGILKKPNVFKNLIHRMGNSDIIRKSDAIIAIDARGFIFGSAISYYSSKPMVVARKSGKLPGDLIELSYELEYGHNTLSIQKDTVKDFHKFVIIDDLLATGGTAKCVSNLIESMGKVILGLSVGAEIVDLKGKSNLNFDVESQIKL